MNETKEQVGGNGEMIKLALEFGPLVAFFIANWKAGIFWATGVFMVAITISLAISLLREGRIPVMPLVTAVFVLVFGGLTLWLQDELFIKLKPTIVNLLFAAILAAGLIFRRHLLKMVLGPVFAMDDEGWRKLTVRWIFFFILLAALNEVVWRNFSTDAWVNFKVFGIMPLTLAFSLLQIPLITKHSVDEQPAE